MMISFSREARYKILALVNLLDTEVGWHGTIELDDETVNVKDIFVYPQAVTNVTVRGDDAGMIKWVTEFDDDTYNSLRMWGHSHNNMDTEPSSLDLITEDSFIKSMPKNGYYLSTIVNKRGKAESRFYLKNNGKIFHIENEQRLTNETVDKEKIPKKYITWAEKQVKKYVKGAKL